MPYPVASFALSVPEFLRLRWVDAPIRLRGGIALEVVLLIRQGIIHLAKLLTKVKCQGQRAEVERKRIERHRVEYIRIERVRIVLWCKG